MDTVYLYNKIKDNIRQQKLDLTTPVRHPWASLRIAFVIPWFGKYSTGGAEKECANLAINLAAMYPNFCVDVLTTSLRDFFSCWNQSYYRQGIYPQGNIRVIRCNAETMDRTSFDQMNAKLIATPVEKLQTPTGPISPLSDEQETFFAKHLICSQSINQFLKINKNSYDFFIFTPYMFATTLHGVPIVADRAIILPCLHDETYAYLNIYRQCFRQARGCLYFVPAEKRLANRLYAIENHEQAVIGAMVDTQAPYGNGAAFRKKFAIKSPYIVYVGRKIENKNLPWLVKIFLDYRVKKPSCPIKLVIMGKGTLSYHGKQDRNIIDLGFISEKDKIDALAGSVCLVQPSVNESFSLVMMESWLQKTPCLVHTRCEVTSDHCKESQGGLLFQNGTDFSNTLHMLHTNSEKRSQMGIAGYRYVHNHFSRKTVVTKLAHFLSTLALAGKSARQNGLSS